MVDSLLLGEMQGASAIDESSESIYDAAQLCSKHFECQLWVAYCTMGGNYTEIRELRGRFNEWAAGVGAFAEPRVSLDARLSPHARIKDMVLEQLAMLRNNLRRVQRIFPFAREGLFNHLGASINERGISLQYLQEYNKKHAYRHNDNDDLETIEGMPKGQINTQVVSSFNKDLAPMEDMIAQDLETRRSAVAPSAVNHIKRNTRYSPSTIITRGSIGQDIQLVEHDFPTESDWETHDDQDIEPYVCISRDCRYPFRFFPSLQSWMDHMRMHHSIDWPKRIYTEKWFCDLDHEDGQPEFNTAEAFFKNLRDCHRDELTWTKMKERVRLNQQMVNRDDPFACPLCQSVVPDIENCRTEKPYERLEKHIAEHLKSLALLSLSYIKEDQQGREGIAGFSERAMPFHLLRSIIGHTGKSEHRCCDQEPRDFADRTKDPTLDWSTLEEPTATLPKNELPTSMKFRALFSSDSR
ncbi:hypothetical protein MKX08_002436 [Trichoderma sp. CBMAI-0020]|nr:hypothetical protein MKX08_002436 [Trichoderma sp. CBMAI-0020]